MIAQRLLLYIPVSFAALLVIAGSFGYMPSPALEGVSIGFAAILIFCAIAWKIVSEPPESMTWWKLQSWLWIIFGVPLVFVGIGIVLLPLGILTLKRQSRWAWIIGTLFGVPLAGWTVNGIYLWRRRKVLRKGGQKSIYDSLIDVAAVSLILPAPLLLLGILSVLVIPNVTGATQKARDIADGRIQMEHTESSHSYHPSPSEDSNPESTDDQRGLDAATNPVAPLKPESTPPPAIQTVPVQGKGYIITPPASWTRQTPNGDKDLEFMDNADPSKASVALVTIREDEQLTQPALLTAVVENLKKVATDLKFSKSEWVAIDDRQWIHFTADGIINGVYMTYDDYVYSGNEGTFQIDGIYATNIKTTVSPIIRTAASTFAFSSNSTTNQ